MTALMDKNGPQVEAIRELLTAADARGLPLWLENGWAIDARLDRITGPHGDIDVAFPKDAEGEHRGLIESPGYAGHEQLDYGFLSWRGGCASTRSRVTRWAGSTVSRVSPGVVSAQQGGGIEGLPVRCVSWQAIYFEMLGYVRDIPKDRWRPKEFESLRLVEAALSEGVRREVERLHDGSSMSCW